MSFEEPKAPIVRIKKKKVKKKTKNNDVVILPVRASQNPRYSNIPQHQQNPQPKSRECCRRMFACCLRLPVCNVVCFRCILPTCYGCTGSDDEEGEANDEGYHSNRRSSELLPQAEGGSGAQADRQEVEMNEIKSETVTPLIPPRTRHSEYRHGGTTKKQTLGAIGGASLNDDGAEMTYIEVESVSLSDMDISSKHIPDNSDSTSVKQSLDYEEPLKGGSILEERLVVSFEKALAARGYGSSSGVVGAGGGTVESSVIKGEAEDVDVSDDSESQYYVNEDVLKPKNEPMQASALDEVDTGVGKHYMNLDNVTVAINESKEPDDIDDGQPHEYINLNPPETIDKDKRESESQPKDDPAIEEEQLTVKLPTRISLKSKSKKEKSEKKKAKKTKSKDKSDSKSSTPEKTESRPRKEGRKTTIRDKLKGSIDKLTELASSRESSVDRETGSSDKSKKKPFKASSLEHKLDTLDTDSVCSKDKDKLIIKETDDESTDSSTASENPEEAEQMTDQTKLI